MPPSYRNDPVQTEIHSGTQPFSIVTIALDRDSGKLLKLWLPSSLLREIPDYPGNGSFLDWSGGSAPDVCLVDFDKGAAKAFNIAELIHQDNPNTAIFAVSSDDRPEVIIQAMRGGCSEYLFKPLVRDQLLEALIRAGSRRRERKERASAQVLTFIGAKGGCGVTTIATQLGALLAGSKRTFLLDLHPSLGDAGLYLGFASNQCHSYELMQTGSRPSYCRASCFIITAGSTLFRLPTILTARVMRQRAPLPRLSMYCGFCTILLSSTRRPVSMNTRRSYSGIPIICTS